MARPHTHALVPDNNGGIEQVLVGVSSGDDIFALSHLPLALLPEPRYSIATNSIISAEVAALSWQLGAYQFTRYKKSKREPATLALAPSAEVASAQQIYAAIKLTRDLVNTPTEDMGPQHLSETAQHLPKSLVRPSTNGSAMIYSNTISQPSTPSVEPAIGRHG